MPGVNVVQGRLPLVPHLFSFLPLSLKTLRHVIAQARDSEGLVPRLLGAAWRGSCTKPRPYVLSFLCWQS